MKVHDVLHFSGT